MEGSSPFKPKNDDDDVLELEHSVSDLHALKKLYGLLQQSCPKTSQLDHHQDSLDEKSRHMFKKLLDGATQQVLECQAKIVSCALDPPTPPLIEESIEETRPETLPDIIQKSTSFSDRLHQYPSVVQCKKHASSNPLLDAATQQFHESQAKIVSSALEFPPVFPSPPLKEPVVEPVPESISNGIRNKIRLWERQSNVQREKQASVDLPIDAATQQFLQCQAKEHVRLSMLKEPGGECRAEPPHDLTEKHSKLSEKLQDCHSIAQHETKLSEKLRDYHSIAQHEKLASCSLSVDAATQQCQQCRAKHQMVSSALKPPPPSLEDHCQLSSSKESGRDSRAEHAFSSTERSTSSSGKLPEFHSIVQCKNHAACNPSVNVAPQKVYQCQAKHRIVSSTVERPSLSLEEHCCSSPLTESRGDSRPEHSSKFTEKSARSSEKVQECHSVVQHPSANVLPQQVHQCQAKIVTSALEPPPPLPPEEPVRPVPLKKPGGELRSDSPPESIQKSTNPSEKLGKCHSIDRREKHAHCKRSVDAATQQFLQCQAMIVASAPEPSWLPPPEESVRPVPLKESEEEHRSEPSEPIQKSTRPSEKLRRSHSVQRGKHPSCTPEVRPTAAAKLNEETAGPSVAEQKIDHKSCRDHERTELKRQKSQRSTAADSRIHHAHDPDRPSRTNSSCRDHERTELKRQKSQRSSATDSRIHHAHDPDRPSRTNSRRMQQSPQHPRAHAAPQHSSQDPRAHAAPRTVTTIGHPSDVAEKQKLIRDDSSEPSDKAVGRADRQPAQRKPSRLAEEGIAVRHSPARPVTTEKNAMQLHRTESRKSDWSRSTILPDQKVDTELSDGSRLRHKEQAGPEKPQSHRRDASPGLHDRSQKGPSRKGGKRLSPCQSNEGSTGRRTLKNAGSSRTLRRSRPVSRPVRPSSSSSSGGSATSASCSSSSSSSKWVPPPRDRPERAKSPPRQTPMRSSPAHKRSPSPETPKRRRSPEKPPHRMLTRHLALISAKSTAAKSSLIPAKSSAAKSSAAKSSLIPAKSSAAKSSSAKSSSVVEKKGYLPKKSEKLALVPARKIFVSDKKTDTPKKSEDKEGTLKRMKDKLAFIFHHHHHHHHHLHPGGPESKAVSNVRRHRSPWEYIGQILHHPTKKKKQVMEAQHGYLHALFDAVVRHIWGTRHQRAAKVQRKRLEKLASRGRGKGIHWWQWFRKRGGMKAASRKKPRFKMAFKNKGKKS